MKKLGCGIGLVLLLLAVASALTELAMWARGAPMTVSIGWLWFQVDGNSLVGFQALIEKRVSPALWTPIQALLTWPTWRSLGILGALLALCCFGLRRRERVPTR